MSRFISDLPDDLICVILSQLAPEDAAQKGLVSQQFYSAAKDEKMWEGFCRQEGYEETVLPAEFASWKEV
jgi:hypothetical protein